MTQIGKAVRLPLEFDPATLAADVAAIPRTGWVPHFNTRYYDGDWSVVSLRSTTGEAGQIYPDPTRTEFRDTPMVALCPALRAAMERFACPLLSVRLLRLQAGSAIREHRDYNLGYEDGEVRIHVPVLTNEQVEFYLDGERLPLKAGQSWYLNLNLPHRVINGGATDRVHLVLDCVVNDWMRGLLEGAA